MIHSATSGNPTAFQRSIPPSKHPNKGYNAAPPLFGHNPHVHGSQCSHNHSKKGKDPSPAETKGFLQRIGGWFQDGWKAITKGLSAFAQWVKNLWSSKPPKKDASQKDSETVTPKPQKAAHNHHGHRCGHRHSHH